MSLESIKVGALESEAIYIFREVVAQFAERGHDDLSVYLSSRGEICHFDVLEPFQVLF